MFREINGVEYELRFDVNFLREIYNQIIKKDKSFGDEFKPGTLAYSTLIGSIEAMLIAENIESVCQVLSCATYSNKTPLRLKEAEVYLNTLFEEDLDEFFDLVDELLAELKKAPSLNKLKERSKKKVTPQLTKLVEDYQGGK